MTARTLLLFMLLVAVSSVVSAQTTGTIAGKILDGDGRPLAGVTVMTLDSMPRRGAYTRADGTYLIRGVRQGKYRIEIKSIGYVTRTETVTVAIDQETRLNATLKPVPVSNEKWYFGPGPVAVRGPLKLGTVKVITAEELERTGATTLFGGWVP